MSVAPSFGGFFDSLRSLRMTVISVVAGLLIGLSGGNVRAADDVVVRASVTPREAWIGQRTLLSIEVLGADGWAQITEMGEFEIPGTYVLRTESQGTRLSETIRGTSYTGQRYQLSVYCQRGGRTEIPAFPVTVTVKQWGGNAAQTPHAITTPPATLICKVPPGAEGIRGLISTNRLEADQTWSARPETAAPGDAITRSMTLSAVDVSGMAFPPVQHPEIDGVGIYPGEPSVTDTTDRGSLRGERVEEVTYLLEQPGEVALPAIVLPWWDIDDGVLRRIELPGLELAVEGEIAPESVGGTEIEPAGKKTNWALLMVLIAVLHAVGFWLVPRLWRWFQARRRAWFESEESAFRSVNRALRSADPGTITAAVMRWLDRLEPGSRPARLDLFLRDHGDDSTEAAAAELARSLANGESFSEPRALARGLKKARRHFRQTLHSERIAASVLPELNGRGKP